MQTKTSKLYDWLFVVFASIQVAGAFIDGWAHVHLDSALETFFTPWHAVFYFGLFGVSALVIGQYLLNLRKGYSWKNALPQEYLVSLLGVGIMLLGGPGDFIWHAIFGIEQGIEALLSPTHLLLAIGGAIMVSGPLHAIWYRPRNIHTGPTIISFALFMLTINFMLQFVQPFNFPWISPAFQAANPINFEYGVGLGVAGTIIFTGIFLGMILACLKHWRFPLGSFTFTLTLNALALSFLEGNYPLIILGALVSGILIDLLYQSLAGRLNQEKYLRLFGFITPVLIFLPYELVIMSTTGTNWSVHMWAGNILISGIAGLLMTYLIKPPEPIA